MTTVIALGYPVPVTARDRIVRSAATLIRERGVHGVGLRQIVAHADGPRGSLQRYFPGGKTQLVTEALNLVGAEILDSTASGLRGATTLADAIDAIFAPWRYVLVESSFTMGCPIAATVVDASADDRLRAQARTSSIAGETPYAPPSSSSAPASRPRTTTPPCSSPRSKARSS